MKSVALFAVKGGVGKSTLAVNLAHAAATQGGRRTLLWDLDAQSAATFLLQREAPPKNRARDAFAEDALDELIVHTDYPNLHILPADRSLRRLEGDLARDDRAKAIRRKLRDFTESYDRILIDCPPGLSELADRVFRAADLLVMPAVPSPLSGRATAQLQEELQRNHKGKPPVLPVWNMADLRRRLHRETVAQTDWPVIPYSAAIEQMSVHRAPVAAFQPGGAVARGYAGLWAQVEAALLRTP
jgi:cellulose biosynthesis protein BcsQ